LTPGTDKIDWLLSSTESSRVVESYLLENDLSYFAEKILNMEIVDHHIEWSELASDNVRIAIMASRDHGKSFFWCFSYVLWRAYHAWMPVLGPEFKSIPRIPLGYVFSNTQDQAIKHLQIVRDELETNPKLAHLLPVKRDSWSKQEMRLANGSIIRARGWGSSVRGAHPVYAVCDDVLSEENFYSELTRNKEKDYLFSAVRPMIIPGGQLIVVGCVRPDTYVLSKNGPVQIRDLAPEDISKQRLIESGLTIHGENGPNTASHLWINGKCKTKRIKTTYGLELEASHRHPIRVRKGISPSYRDTSVWRRMDELETGQYVQIKIGQNVYGNEFKDAELAYFMGLWTAEGSSEKCGRLTICSADDTIKKYLSQSPFGLNFSTGSDGRRHRCQSKVFYDYLKELGVKYVRAQHKVVPKCIFSAPKEVQQAFIRGFADGDGNSYINKNIQQINLASTSYKLIDGLRAMLMNMGIMPSYQIQKPGVSELVKGKLECHVLKISAAYAYTYMSEIGFTVLHKKKKFRKYKNIPDTFWAGIKSIEDGECETLDFVIPDDHTFCSNGFISHNTPFHQADMYSDLRENKSYTFRVYPACDENFGKVLWPTRYPAAELLKIQEEVGHTRFAREYRCNPISDDTSLFPEKILRECFDTNFEMPSMLTKEERAKLEIYTGVDLAMSTTVGADYTVILTIGIDEFKNRWILDIRRKKGLTMTEQLREIEDVWRNYGSQKIYIEDNSFQRVFKDELVRRTDMPVEGFTTTRYNKNSIEKGVPSLQILFENRKFVIPRKTERDRRITNIMLHELKCFTWHEGKLQGLGTHDDTVMALWIANEAASSSSFSFTFG